MNTRQNHRMALVGFGLVVIGAIGSLTIGAGEAHSATLPHRACKMEDGRWCVWDAKHTGDGRGRSFYADHKGRVHYISHAKAHRLLHHK